MKTGRRSFLAGVAAVPAAAFGAAQASGAPTSETVPLNGAWRFRADGDWREVTLPHTWQIADGLTEHYGRAEYERTFFAPAYWSGCAVRLRFEAVFHSAVVTVNGRPAGEHLRKGYTAFTFDVHPLLKFDAMNTVRVQVDNSFDEQMLPRGKSSDWAHDGGIYRPVALHVTPTVYVERLEIDAAPQGTAAAVDVKAIVRNCGASAFAGTVSAGIEGEASSAGAECRVGPGTTAIVRLSLRIENARLWHFDHPHLYRLRVRLSNGHEASDRFGVRSIETRDNGFFLNGERVRLMGVERMAGSNPEFGMAEPADWIRHDHVDMRALNCIYTRVHWPQDRRVLDWCDEHGMLIQTEVPAWGGRTFAGMKDLPSDEILNNGLEQLREMIAEARNHPCIFSWGLCNEINGQNAPAASFVRTMYREAKRLDPKRLATYASNSLQKTPKLDVAGEMDYIMWNEYYESWYGGNASDLARNLDEIHRAFPEKAIVISEYGYCACTAERPEDDAKRAGILARHDAVFRERPWVAGLIFFCYNDYRTHVGDKGIGALKQRVHGVVDLYGNRKPSWEELRHESSPARLTLSGPSATVEVRDTVPAYALRGYRLRALSYGPGDIPLEKTETTLPDLKPGAKFETPIPTGAKVVINILRPTGEPV